MFSNRNMTSDDASDKRGSAPDISAMCPNLRRRGHMISIYFARSGEFRDEDGLDEH